MNPRSGVWRLLSADVAVPIAAYYLLRAVGVGDLAALASGAALSLSRVVIAAVRTRRLDAVAAIVLCFFALGLLGLAISGNARVALAADSLPTALVGLWFLGSLLVGRALAFYLLLPLLSGGRREQEPFWRQAWQDGPTFRRAVRVLTFGWGCLLVAEAVARLVLVVLLPVDVMVGVSKALQVALVLAMVGFAGWHGKRTGMGVRPYLDSIQESRGEPLGATKHD